MVQKDYHGKSFEGRQCSKLISKFDTLAALIPFESLPIVNCLCLFEKVVEATFGHVLSPNYEEVISRFGVSFTTIMSTFHISMAPKVHIVLHHIPQFIRMTQMPLGLFSEEVAEEQSKRFLKFYKRYFVNCKYIIATFLTGFLILLYTIIPIIYKCILQIQLSALMFGCAWSAGGKCS